MRRTFSVPQHAHSLPILRHVHQVQQDRQGAGDNTVFVTRQACQRVRQLGQRRRLTAVSHLGQVADLHDGGETVRTRDLANRLVQTLLQTGNNRLEFLGFLHDANLPLAISAHAPKPSFPRPYAETYVAFRESRTPDPAADRAS